MISLKELVARANQLVADGNLSELNLLQLSALGYDVGTTVVKVQNISNLPTASENAGRLIFIIDEARYYYSDGVEWLSDFDSELTFISNDVYAWGLNASGLLSNGTTDNTSSPIMVIPIAGGNWQQLSAGYYMSVFLSTDGLVWAAGQNNQGQLGDNTTVNKSSPVTVVGGITNWTQVSAGFGHVLGIRDDGTAWAWGNNQAGRLGDNSTVNRSSPVSVVGGITNWSEVSAGASHSAGVTTAGLAYAWGNNGNGRLGDNSTTSRLSPISVVGGITNWRSISAGDAHTVAIREDGTAWAWGSNGDGRLGDNSTTSRLSPVSVVGGITNWAEIKAANTHTLGLTDSGILYTWGANSNGQLGTNNTTPRSSPVAVVGGITNWTEISCGRNQCAGITSQGDLYTWGHNDNGQLGLGDIVDRSSPNLVIGGVTGWLQIAVSPRRAMLGRAVETKGF